MAKAVALCSGVGFAPAPLAAAVQPQPSSTPQLSPQLSHVDTSHHPNPSVFLAQLPPSSACAELSHLTRCLSGFTLRWLCFIEGWDIRSYDQRVLWRSCSPLEKELQFSQSAPCFIENMSLCSTIYQTGAGRNLGITVCCNSITLAFLGVFKSTNT